MPILHVRNVPDELYEHIRRQAFEQNRSLSAHVIYLLERAVFESPQSQRQVLENIHNRLLNSPIQSGVPNSLSLLHQDRGR